MALAVRMGVGCVSIESCCFSDDSRVDDDVWALARPDKVKPLSISKLDFIAFLMI